MNGNGNPHWTSLFAINVVATVDTHQDPAMTFKQSSKAFAGHGFHTTISTIRSFRFFFTVATSTDKQPSTAS